MSKRGAANEFLLGEDGLNAAPAQGRVTTSLLITAAIGALNSGQYGWNIGVINDPQDTIISDLGLDPNGWAWPMVVASFCIAGYAASLVSAKAVDALGRKTFLVYDSILFVIAGGCALASSYLKGTPTAGYALLILSRVFAGFGSGAATVAVPMYLGEVAHLSVKGSFGAVNQFMIVVFILIAQLVGIGMSTSNLWGWMMAITTGIGVASILLAPAMVESPRWLVSKKGDREAAKAVLLRLRGYDDMDADAEIAEMEEEQAAAAAAKSAAGGSGGAPSLRQIIADPVLRVPLLVAIVLQLTQQFSGINAVFFYSTSFFKAAGFSQPIYGTVAAGAVNLVATALAMPLIDRAGRKPLLLASSVGMLLCAVGITVALVEKDAYPADNSALGTFSVVLVLLFVVLFEFGLGPIPWSWGSEAVPEEPRATIMAVAAGFNWGANTIVGLFFPFLQQALGNYSFLPFAGWLTAASIFMVFMVAETKGKTPAEVLRWYNKGADLLGSD